MLADRLDQALRRTEEGVNRHRRKLAAIGLAALLSVPVYSALSRLNEGVGYVNPGGEGWHLSLRGSSNGIQLDYASRYNGINPVPCKFEGPLTYTTFTQWHERWVLSGAMRIEKTWSSGRVSNNLSNLCEPAPWPANLD